MLEAKGVVNVKFGCVHLCRASNTDLLYPSTIKYHRIVALYNYVPNEYMGNKGSLGRVGGSCLNDLNPRYGYACHERRVASL